MAVLASGILILASLLLQSSMKNIHYTILKTIGSFSAIVAPFSLGVVVFVPSEDLNSIAYTVLCVIFAGLLYLFSLVSNFACAYHQEKWHFNSYPVHWSFLLVILVPLLITSALFFSRSSSGLYIIITFPHFNAYYISDIDANGVIWRKCERNADVDVGIPGTVRISQNPNSDFGRVHGTADARSDYPPRGIPDCVL
ncbi:hypothetical protein Tco_0243476 [Tanacetum coccineum]